LKSCLALAIVCIHVGLFGAEQALGQGASAHIFQLLSTAQVPLIAAFAISVEPDNGEGAWP
jgi:hypothetical protein